MLVFFAFFTGASTMQTILTEDEKGTLSRLFTTPTSHLTILGGKALSTFIVLTIQVTVLMLFGWLVFGIDWGEPLPVFMAAVGIIIIAGTFGLFLVSLMKDTRQAGMIFGGLLTILGMVGMITVFTAGVPNVSPAVKTVSLMVPQGWAIRGLQAATERQSMSEMWLVLGVILLWSLVFALIGQYRMRKRYS
jgi:ABC-2 type transport system permease protein